MSAVISFELWGEVEDLQTLFNAAKARAIEEGNTEVEADAYCRDADGKMCARHCLQMLFDPGSIPGFEVHGSECD